MIDLITGSTAIDGTGPVSTYAKIQEMINVINAHEKVIEMQTDLLAQLVRAIDKATGGVKK